MRPKNALFFITAVTLFLMVNNIVSNNGFNPQGSKTSVGVVNGSYATMLIPAVGSEGNGIITNLTVQIKPGNGRSLVDINDLFFWVDTQNSIRTAKDVAEKFTGADLRNYDIIYSIVTNASAVEGPSAGAAISIATIAALENKNLRNGVMITGTINADGSIGKVGDVLQKSIAAKSFNATLFLVPVGQSSQTANGYEKICRNYIVSKICSSRWTTKDVNLENETGIRVIEVKDVKDAMKYMVVQ